MEKIKALREYDIKKLKDTLVTLRKESFNLRFQKSSGQLEKTSRINLVRKQIAKIKTIIKEKDKI
tara:strand:- start:975 stop:1169 length:195 start_codon:yes stop_codon:yes gene_type:complete